MKLLVVAQMVDSEDPVFGFFHRWIEELALRTDTVHVICLRGGQHTLPPNVYVHSLGKEKGARSRFVYSKTFLTLVWNLRNEYDVVFVHQNQEYLLIAGILWKLLKKPAYLWRNHYAGSILTDIAALFCKHVFCTSKHSYTAAYKKTLLMPVGVDLSRFYQEDTTGRAQRSILFLSRIAPSKRPEILINALGILLSRGISFTCSVYGSPRHEDTLYHESIKARAEAHALHDRIRFFPGIAHEQTPSIYAKHDIFINCSPSGMFDKTLFEAAASGCRVFSTSEDFRDIAGESAYFYDSDSLATVLEDALAKDQVDIDRERIKYRALARGESLGTLMDKLVQVWM